MVNPVPCHIKLMNFPFAGNSFVYAFNVKTCFTKMTATGIVFFSLLSSIQFGVVVAAAAMMMIAVVAA